MKNAEMFQGLWRDHPLKQCCYAACLGGLVVMILYMNVIEPKLSRRDFLLKEKERLFHTLPSSKFIPEKGSKCHWDKKENTWYVQGSFAKVYQCALGEDSEQSVSSMLLQKSIAGVSMTLSGMPA